MIGRLRHPCLLTLYGVTGASYPPILMIGTAFAHVQIENTAMAFSYPAGSIGLERSYPHRR